MAVEGGLMKPGVEQQTIRRYRDSECALGDGLSGHRPSFFVLSDPDSMHRSRIEEIPHELKIF
ncbi:MAG: hypothetical protein IPK58_00445 [Acidobacteria bacterium]|nr:hypothetical protein [Acidobacteriota bacterium]